MQLASAILTMQTLMVIWYDQLEPIYNLRDCAEVMNRRLVDDASGFRHQDIDEQKTQY